MMRAVHGAIVAALLLGTWTAAGQHPNAAKGFEADKVYQVGDADSVNLYNGNVTLTIPLGQDYGGNGTLRYRLALAYNSKKWDQIIDTYQCAVNDPDPNCNGPYLLTMPSRRSNAGMGWLVSLGRLIAPDDPIMYGGNWVAGQADWVYESPDGADHSFTAPDPAEADTAYTSSGSFLRLRHLASGLHEVHFPDGMIHKFLNAPDLRSPRLSEIRDPFGNRLAVTYASNGDWTLTEYDASGASLRTHYLRFLDTTTLPGQPVPDDVPPNYDFAVSEIDLAAFDQRRAVYSFTYKVETIQYGCGGDTPWGTLKELVVPRLSKVALPDQSSWEFDYYTAGCSAVKKMTLPTKGTVEWTYQPWEMPVMKCRQQLVPHAPFLGTPPWQVTEGIATKTVTTSAGAAQWVYNQKPARLSDMFVVCEDSENQPISGSKHQESVVTVFAPGGSKSEHFFSVFPHTRGADNTNLEDGNSECDKSEYGLSFTRAEGANGEPCKLTNGSALCLSSRVYAANGNRHQSTFVRYDGETRLLEDGEEQYRREAARRTVDHLPDGSTQYVETRKSDYDGLGHYRTTRTSDASSGVARLEYTNFNSAKPSVSIDPVTWANTPAVSRPGTAENWLFSLFTEKRVGYTDELGALRSGTILKSEYAFDTATGALLRTRSLKNLDQSQSIRDVIVKYDRDTLGNVTSESFYGGDIQSVNTGALSSLTLGTPEYRIKHGYQYGARNDSAAMSGEAVTLRLFSATIDKSTGRVDTEKDAADVAVDYHYDTSGRLESVTPDGRARTFYSYPVATATVNAKVTETVKSVAGAVLNTRTFEYDGLGRVIQERVSMPDGQESRRDMTYDPAGRWKRVSELGSATTLPMTTFHSDEFGRPVTVTAPDASVTSFSYSGGRLKTSTASLATPANPALSVQTKHEFDMFGRLAKVTERSGPTSASNSFGAEVTTTYTYDPGDRLTNVTMAGAESVVQHRVFDYDGRGFLLWESHPEPGMSSYSYDSRGHVRTTLRGAAKSPFDLKFDYDAAERLKEVKGRNPHYVPPGTADEPEFRLIKEFAYGEENATDDRRKGKLLTATRYNYPPPSAPTLGEHLTGVYKVAETYAYKDTAGRRTDRTTSISKTDPMTGAWTAVRDIATSFTYDDLDSPAVVSYPMCEKCGVPVDWNKALISTYDRGRVKTVQGLVDEPITYWPNGVRHQMKHTNNIVDTTTIDLNTMMGRPLSMKSEVYDSCTAPVITQPPVGGRITSQTPTVPLSVTVSGSGPFTYQWYANLQDIPNAPNNPSNQASYNASPTATTKYYVKVSNRCRAVLSSLVTVSVGSDCDEPWVTVKPPSSTGDKMWKLQAEAGGAGPLVFAWYSKGIYLGNTQSITVGPVNETTSYSVEVTNSCSSVVADTSVTIEVPLPITAGGLDAVVSGSSINVTWPPSAGAARYQVERRSGASWESKGYVTSASYLDPAPAPGRTYAYRVRAEDANGKSVSLYSNSDVATIMTFTPVPQNGSVSFTHFNEMLGAVNVVRQAAGWPAVVWSNIVASNHPLPNPGVAIRAAHVTSCRARMNEALQALGVPVEEGYTDPSLVGVPIRREHVSEVQGRTQ